MVSIFFITNNYTIQYFVKYIEIIDYNFKDKKKLPKRS